MTAHIIFDVNMDAEFVVKTRFVADEPKVDTPPPMTYASVVSKYSVQIVLMMSVLNGIYVKCSDVQNTYPNENLK